MLFVLIFLLTVQCATGGAISAQTTNPCVAALNWAFGEEPWPFGWFLLGLGAGNFSYLLGAHLAVCHPLPECHTCQAKASTPVFLGDGDTYIEDTDISLPGLGGGLTLRRRWNSVWPLVETQSVMGLFGPSWRSTYEERVFMSSPPDNWVKYSRSDGDFWQFGIGDTGAWVVASPGNVSATLSSTPSGVEVTFLNGETRVFGARNGFLSAIIDRNNNKTQLTYDESNRLVEVTSPASQHLYFNYASNNPPTYLVTSVTSDFGVTLSYSYNTAGQLIQVTKPDQTTVSYTYNSQGQISTVTDSNGKVLESHTYVDSLGHALTSSQANGVNSVTITYPQ